MLVLCKVHFFGFGGAVLSFGALYKTLFLLCDRGPWVARPARGGDLAPLSHGGVSSDERETGKGQRKSLRTVVFGEARGSWAWIVRADRTKWTTLISRAR